MPEKILAIDDDPAQLRMIELTLAGANFDPITATGGEAGLTQLLEHRPELVILDVMMPDMDGWETCYRIRQVSTVPIIFLTAKQTIDDRVAGLRLGGDDYLVKPFNPGELIARVEAVLRRAHRPPIERDSVITVGKYLAIDRGSRQVVVRGEPVQLRPAEYNLLVVLAERIGQVVSADRIGDLLGIAEPGARARRVKWHVWKLRQSLERDPSQPEMIVTEPGGGYRLVPLE
ncbi:MAG TPA: response regulator transcription factor [Anaerolineae bacterium]|nr:response regulator transcription factor [Anaerolineae bacterium]